MLRKISTIMAYHPRPRRSWRQEQADNAVAKVIQKPKQERQRLLLLKSMEPGYGDKVRGLKLHVEGGYTFKGDLQDLVARGLMKMVREYHPSWTGRCRNISVLYITDKGKEFLNKK